MRQRRREIVRHLSPTEDVQLSFIALLDINESAGVMLRGPESEASSRTLVTAGKKKNPFKKPGAFPLAFKGIWDLLFLVSSPQRPAREPVHLRL